MVGSEIFCMRQEVNQMPLICFVNFGRIILIQNKNVFQPWREEKPSRKMRAKLREIKVELRRRLYIPIGETGKWFNRILTGHLHYLGIPGNGQSLNSFYYQVTWHWFCSLRRSQRTRMTWERFGRLRALFIPTVIITPLNPALCTIRF